MTLIADHEAFYRSANYPLVADCDIEAEIRDEASDLCVAVAEKYKDNLEKATQVRGCSACSVLYHSLVSPGKSACLTRCDGKQSAKEALDKKLGGKWHVIMGNDFGYRVTHEVET